jgi:hypothetical protein
MAREWFAASAANGFDCQRKFARRHAPKLIGRKP